MPHKLGAKGVVAKVIKKTRMLVETHLNLMRVLNFKLRHKKHPSSRARGRKDKNHLKEKR